MHACIACGCIRVEAHSKQKQLPDNAVHLKQLEREQQVAAPVVAAHVVLRPALVACKQDAMALELIDYLFVFWCALSAGIFLIGSLYDQQRKQALADELKKKKKQDAIEAQQQARYDYAHQQQRQQQQHQTYSSTSSKPLETSLGHWNEPSYGGSGASESANWREPTYNSNIYNHYDASTSLGDWRRESVARDNQQRSYQNSAATSHHQTLIDNETIDASSNTAHTIPTATGFNSDCVDWVNSVLYLFYTQPERYGPIIRESIYRSLNERLSNITSTLSSSDQSAASNLIIEFTSINASRSTRPELTNVRTESESDKSVSATCKIYNERISLDLNIQRAHAGSRILAGGVGGAGFGLGANDHAAATSASMNADNNDQSVVQYELVLENLEGKLKSMAMVNDKLIVVQFTERPDTKITLKPKQLATSSNLLISEDALVSLIVQALTQVVIDLYFGDDPEFPQYKHLTGYMSNKLNALKSSASEIKRQIKQEFFSALSSSADKERKVLVKIIKAKNINYNQSVTCLVEVDAPYQRAFSSTKPASSNPFWDEHFLLNAADKTKELTVELWDSIAVPGGPAPKLSGDTSTLQRRGRNNNANQQMQQQQNVVSKAELLSMGGKFLGLARVSVDQLRREPVQKMTVALQSRQQSSESASPGDLSYSVGGELELDFLFLEHSVTNSSGAGASSSSGLKKSGSACSLVAAYNADDIVSVERKLTPSGYVITTTTITKPPRSKQQQQQAQQHGGGLDQLSVGGQQRSNSPLSSSVATEPSELDMNAYIGDDARSNAATASQAAQGESETPVHRSRSRSRSLLRAIKKRFSFSRQRSRSVGGTQGDNGSLGGTRSALSAATADSYADVSPESRSRASSEASMVMGGGRARSVPPSTSRGAAGGGRGSHADTSSEVPMIVINKSRLSVDAASAYTFTHPKSQLVIECREPRLSNDGIGPHKTEMRYFAISESMANKGKWRRKGTKLHLFNEHQFVACHLPGSSTCHLCGRVFSRRPGKQGYKCRNCFLLSHKQCHVKVDHNCPYAKREGLKLEYIDADPPAALIAEAEAVANAAGVGSSRSGGTLPRSGQSTVSDSARHGRLTSKSISMDVDDR